MCVAMREEINLLVKVSTTNFQNYLIAEIKLHKDINFLFLNIKTNCVCADSRDAGHLGLQS